LSQFSFAVPILPGKTDAWGRAVAEIKGPRWVAYKESRKKLGIKREHVSLQHTPQGDMAVVHMEAKDPASVMPAMLAGVSEFDTWFLDAVLRAVHGLDPKAPPPPPTEVFLDFKG